MRYLVGILACGLFFFSPASAWADALAPMPAVSFSPPVINFGAVPSDIKCTQLVTVTLKRSVFPDHLLTLVPYRGLQAEVSLFARFDDPNFIRLVYRITIDAYSQTGPFFDSLILVDNPKAPVPYPPDSLEENNGVAVVGESVQELEGPSLVDFGNVAVGKTRTKKILVGFSAPNMVRVNRNVLDAEEKKFWLDFPRALGLSNMSAVSSFADVTVSSAGKLGMDASIFQEWTVTLRAHLPLGRANAELRLGTQDGYCATVPVTAEVVPADKLERRTPKKH